MRVDPKESIAGQPALFVRQTLRRLRVQLQWGLKDLEATASLEAGKAQAFQKTLLAEGLVESAGQAPGRLRRPDKVCRQQRQPSASRVRLRKSHCKNLVAEWNGSIVNHISWAK